MKTFQLVRETAPAAAGDVVPRSLRVHRKESAAFIVAACERRGFKTSQKHDPRDGFDIFITCSAQQLEEVRETFNSRHRHKSL